MAIAVVSACSTSWIAASLQEQTSDVFLAPYCCSSEDFGGRTAISAGIQIALVLASSMEFTILGKQCIPGWRGRELLFYVVVGITTTRRAVIPGNCDRAVLWINLHDSGREPVVFGR